MPRFPTLEGGEACFVGVGVGGTVTAVRRTVLDDFAHERPQAGDGGNDEPEVKFDDCPEAGAVSEAIDHLMRGN